MSKKQKQLKKRSKWRETDEQFLLKLWEETFKMLRGSRKNNHIYKEMANCFVNRDRQFSAEEIRVKLHNLQSRYRKEKQLVNASEGDPSDWKLFHHIRSIIEQQPIQDMDSMVEDSIKKEDESMFDCRSSPTLPCISPTASCDIKVEDADPETPVASKSNAVRKRKINYSREIHATEKRIMHQIDQLQKSDAELISIQRERNAIIERFVSSTEQFQKDLMAYLNK